MEILYSKMHYMTRNPAISGSQQSCLSHLLVFVDHIDFAVPKYFKNSTNICENEVAAPSVLLDGLYGIDNSRYRFL